MTNGSRSYPKGKWRTGGPGIVTTPEPEDPVVVRRLILGDLCYVAFGAAVRRAALDEVDRDGASARDVAERLGCTVRTVQRHRARRRCSEGDGP